MPTKPLCIFLRSVLAVIVLSLSGVSALGAITVTETVLPNGDSSIEVVNPIRGITRTYNINLSTHHSPATSPNDPLVQKFESWKYGALLSYNLNNYTGVELEWADPDPAPRFSRHPVSEVGWAEKIPRHYFEHHQIPDR